MTEYERKPLDRLAALATAEIILSAYDGALQGLNACLALINESMNERAFEAFHEIFEGMSHIGHAYSVLIGTLTEDQ